MELFIFARFNAREGQEAAVAAVFVPSAIRACSGFTRAGSTKPRSRPMPSCRTPCASWNVYNS